MMHPLARKGDELRESVGGFFGAPALDVKVKLNRIYFRVLGLRISRNAMHI